MPRAFCPECGSEVPVDAEGVCHVGHLVDVGGASVAPSGDVEVQFREPPAPASDPDEPEPWVASLDDLSPEPEAPTPPPSSPSSAPPAASAPPDEPAWSPDEPAGAPDEIAEPAPHDAEVYDVPSAGDDDLAAAAAAAAAALSEPGAAPDDEDDFETWHGDIESGIAAPGWSPPGDPIAPPPQPPPAPLDAPQPSGPAPQPPAEDLDGDFDFDELEAAVGGLPDDTGRGRDYPADDVSPAATFQELAGDRSESPPSPADVEPASPPPAPPADEPAESPPPPRSAPPSTPAEAEAEDVDLSNFTARGGKRGGGAKGGGEKRGRFRRG